MTRARDVANVLSTATSLATDTETAAAISSHNTAGNGHYLRGTTANRPGSPAVGDLYFDTTLDTLIQYKTTGWQQIAPVPNAPTNVVATGISSTSVSVSFDIPTNVPVSSYTVTSFPGNITASASNSPISVIGLTTGTAYTFTVVAQGSNGNSSSSAASNSITPSLPTVTGGTLASDTTYYYRTFTSSGTLSVSNASLNADILMISGGAGGDGNWAGGGGAGGVLYYSGQTLLGTKSVTIGAGGTGADWLFGPPYRISNPGAGTQSTFTGLTAPLGGGVSGSEGASGSSGGSGGGGGRNAAGGSGTSGQGNNGGSGSSNCGGGGGGAGGNGANGSGSTGGGGGAGTSTYSSWGIATSTGQNISGTRWYAGGGGGCGTGGTSGGSGGGGSGANGGDTQAAGGAGSANTGGGGGGGAGTYGDGGNGGSGIIIVRYTKAQVGG